MHKGSPVLQAHSVVSFRAYEAKQKSRLKAMYPFLSADQINGKLKKQWKELEESERKHFTKTCLKVTPVKEYCNKTSKRKASSVEKSTASYKRQNREKLHVCNTPEYVNTEKLYDFRKQHKETYKNDFFKTKTSRDNGQNTTDIFGPSYSCNETNRDAKKIDQRRGHVSMETSVNEKDPTIDGSYKSDDDNDFSDEDTAVLLRRNELDICPAGDTFSNSSDDDSDSNVLIKRQMSDTEEVTSEECQEQQDDDVKEKLMTNACTGKRRNESSEFGKPKKANLNEDLGNVSVEMVDSEDKEMESESAKSSQDDVLFKSPMQKKSKRLRKRKASPKGKQLAVSRTPVIGNIQQHLKAQKTPAVQSIQEETNHVTPQMDEVLQQIALNKVSKAPQKKKPNTDQVAEADRLKALVAGSRVTRSLMSTTSERKVEKENIRVSKDKRQTSKNTPKARKEEGEQPVRESKKASATKLKARQNTGGKPGRMPKKVVAEMHHDLDDSLGMMNPSGAASQSIGMDKPDADEQDMSEEAMDLVERGAESAANRMQPVEEFDLVAEDSLNMDHVRSDELLEHLDSETDLLPPYSESCSSSQESSSSVAESQKKRCRKMNPTLLRALKSLQMTSPAGQLGWSSSEHSDSSSPRLLSPALSGVSELSSVSSGEDSEKVSQDIHRSTNTGAIKPCAESMEDGLCGMFGEVTPPDKKKAGIYKTTRILASAGSDRSKNFKQMFNDDEDLLFC